METGRNRQGRKPSPGRKTNVKPTCQIPDDVTWKLGGKLEHCLEEGGNIALPAISVKWG